jgi:uncharacterized membrane protein
LGNTFYSNSITKDEEIIMTGKMLAISLALLVVWVLFLFTVPDLVVQFVALAIAGWQIGSWIFKISYHFSKDWE